MPRYTCKCKDPQHIKDLCRLRRSTTDRSEKTRLTKEILRERMLSRIAWWSDLEQTAARGDYTAVEYIRRRSSPKPDYNVLVRSAGSKRGAVDLVRKHLEDVFCKAIPPDEEAHINASLESMSSCLREQDYVPFANEEILTVVANRKTSKTAGESGVSNEFLKCLAACEQGLDMLQHFLSLMFIRGGGDLDLIRSCVCCSYSESSNSEGSKGCETHMLIGNNTQSFQQTAHQQIVGSLASSTISNGRPPRRTGS